MSVIYLISIIVTIISLGLIDWRYRLCFFKKPKATSIAILAVMAILLIWDFIGIDAGIFFSGQSEFMTGIYIARDVPIEELGLLFVIAYIPLIVHSLTSRRKYV